MLPSSKRGASPLKNVENRDIARKPKSAVHPLKRSTSLDLRSQATPRDSNAVHDSNRVTTAGIVDNQNSFPRAHRPAGAKVGAVKSVLRALADPASLSDRFRVDPITGMTAVTGTPATCPAEPDSLSEISSITGVSCATGVSGFESQGHDFEAHSQRSERSRVSSRTATTQGNSTPVSGLGTLQQQQGLETTGVNPSVPSPIVPSRSAGASVNTGNQIDRMDSANRVSNGMMEKIFVTVRVRPLNQREVAACDKTVWEVVGDSTLRYLLPLPERCPYPSNYYFGE